MEITQTLIEKLEQAEHTEMANALRSHSSLRVLVTHHGSRGLGATVFTRGLDKAIKLTRKIAEDIPPSAAWIPADSKDGKDYWAALEYVARWTRANHECIHQRYLESISAEKICTTHNVHNFVWERDGTYYHGKGATPAWKTNGKQLLGLIPLNMAEPILLVLGNDNGNFLSFAPHGAGRNLSRTAILKRYKTKQGIDQCKIETEINIATKDISVRWYLGKPDITETPIAYKNAEEVIRQIEQFKLADVVGTIQPLGCIMAGRAPRPHEKPLTPKQLRQMQHRKDRRKLKQKGFFNEI